MTDSRIAYNKQPYLEKLRKALRSGAIPTAPGTFALDVRHDPACPVLDGSGLCGCDPEVTYLGEMQNRRERRAQRKAGRRRSR